MLGNAAKAVVAWLGLLLVLSVTEMQREQFAKDPFTSYTFFVLQLPLFSLVMFGAYSLCDIGYHLMVLGKLLKLIQQRTAIRHTKNCSRKLSLLRLTCAGKESNYDCLSFFND